MKHGFFKVAAAVNEIRVADCRYNAEKIIELIEEAKKKAVKLLVFPELSVTGATAGDLFYQDVLLNDAKEALFEIADSTRKSECLTVVSLPVMVKNEILCCAAFLYDGEILGFVPKSNITGTGKRVFSKFSDSLSELQLSGKNYPIGTKLIFEAKGMENFSIACEIGEDLLSVITPSVKHALSGATVIVNPASFYEIVGMKEKIKEAAKNTSEKLCSAYISVSPGYGESTQDMVFSGYSIICEKGKVLSESKTFENGLTITEIDADKLVKMRLRNDDFKADDETYKKISFSLKCEETPLTRKIEKNPFLPEDANINEICKDILEIQAHGLKKRLAHTNAKCAVIGISGGLDSTLALLVADLAMKKLGRSAEDIYAVTMPCFGTTKRTKGNAEKLCEILGTSFETIDIKKSVTQHFIDIGHDDKNRDVVYENAQARERTKILMDIANAKGGMVIGTGDMSELALGWATYNGDHMSMYGVNASVPKTVVRRIVECAADMSDNEELKSVLYDIVNTPVSPELLPPDEGEISQKTEELVGPYELHDFYLYYLVKYGFSPDKIKRMANYAMGNEYDKEEIERWMNTFVRRFFSQQFKRSCLPDGPKVGSVNLSPRGEFNMPSDAAFASWLK